MENDNRELVKPGSDAWTNLQAEIIDRFKPGELISHQWLRDKFNFRELSFNQFVDSSEFIRAYDLQKFAYLTLIDTLRWELLESHKVYLNNIYGDGYAILHPKEQCGIAFERAFKDLKKIIRETNLIMNNRLAVDHEQQTADNNLKARFAMLSSFITGIKKGKIVL